MTDQCGRCTSKGNLNKCKETPCGHHENWYAIEQQKRIDDLEKAICCMAREELGDMEFEDDTECLEYFISFAKT